MADGDELGEQVEQEGQAQGQQTEPATVNGDGQGQGQAQSVERIPGNLDNFFKWAQSLTPAAKPNESGASDEAKETLRQIESHHRAVFEAVFKRQYRVGGETKDSMKKKISLQKKWIENIGMLEKTFAEFKHFQELLQFDGDYELAVIDKQSTMPLWELNEETVFVEIDMQSTILLSEFREDRELDLASYEECLQTMENSKKPVTEESRLLDDVFRFLAFNGYEKPLALEITKLLIWHETGLYPKGEKLPKKFRELLDFFDLPRKHRHRKKG